MRSKSYEDRLKELNMQSLEQRRERGDMIQVWKILNKHDNLEAGHFFQHFHNRNNQTRLLNYDSRQTSESTVFLFGVINSWNSLPRGIKLALTLNSFKSKYDRWICENNRF